MRLGEFGEFRLNVDSICDVVERVYDVKESAFDLWFIILLILHIHAIY